MAKRNTDLSSDRMNRELGSELRVYELGFHLDPNLSNEGVKEAYQNVRSRISDKAVIIAEGEPQKIPLAYTISRDETGGRRDFDSAYFSWIVYETSVSEHSAIVANAGADKNIIRFIDLATDKDAARHFADVRELSLKMRERDIDIDEDVETEASSTSN